jgi:hypothetical protein
MYETFTRAKRTWTPEPRDPVHVYPCPLDAVVRRPSSHWRNSWRTGDKRSLVMSYRLAFSSLAGHVIEPGENGRNCQEGSPEVLGGGEAELARLCSRIVRGATTRPVVSTFHQDPSSSRTKHDHHASGSMGAAAASADEDQPDQDLTRAAQARGRASWGRRRGWVHLVVVESAFVKRCTRWPRIGPQRYLCVD